MRFKISFHKKNNESGDIIIPINYQKELNSFIYRTLGDNNVYHDTFSDYSISSIQGGKLNDDKKTLIFRTEEDRYPYIMVSSENDEFMKTLIINLYKKKYTLFGLEFHLLSPADFRVEGEWDVIHTISPVIVKHNHKRISIDNPYFMDELKKHCVEKLKSVGVEDETFNIKLRKPERAKKKLIMVGDIFNICTDVSLFVYGKVETRKTLYNLGLGISTGSGFGAVKVYEKNKAYIG